MQQRPRIAILGSAPSSVQLAPFADKRWQIWACSPANLAFNHPRIDVWFEMHSWSLEQKRKTNPPYYGWLKKRPCVFMQEEDKDEFPGSRRYPIEEVRKRWPWGSRFFLTSSPALMMACALLQEPEVIGLWGIDMAGHTEWQWQKPGCHYWAEQAERQGCAVIAPGESDILTPPPTYGYCESTHMWRKLNARRLEVERRMAQATEIIKQHEKTALVLQGAHESCMYELRTWIPDQIDDRMRPLETGRPQEVGMDGQAKVDGQAKAFADHIASLNPVATAPVAPAPVAEVIPPKKAKPVLKGRNKDANSTIIVGKPAKNGKSDKNQAQKQATHRGASGSLPPLDGAGSMGGSSADDPPHVQDGG